ncbi:MAG: hypothetical protein WCF57_08720 [Pyrinomonadaceae bacterium]
MVANKLADILERKTKGRVSLSSFVSLYVRILSYPADVSRALSKGEINVREAASLARLTAERLSCSPPEARKLRAELLKAHLLANGSQSSLCRRVKVALGEWPEVDLKLGKAGSQKADELLEANPYDARHLFYEEIQLLIEAMREIDPEDLQGDTLTHLLRQIDKLLNRLRLIRSRKQLSR